MPISGPSPVIGGITGEGGTLPELPGITLNLNARHIPVGSIVERLDGRRHRVEGHAIMGYQGDVTLVRFAGPVTPGWVTPDRGERVTGAVMDEAVEMPLDPTRAVCGDPNCTQCYPRAVATSPRRRSWRTGPLLGSWAAAVEPIKRVFFKADLTDPEDRIVQKRRRVPEEDANLVSSLVDDGDEHTRMHAPVLDIDLPCRLVPSTTEGHFHLYIDKKMTWERYALLLNALMRAGVIEEGFYKMSMKREATFVRKPGVLKEEGDISSSEGVPDGPMLPEAEF